MVHFDHVPIGTTEIVSSTVAIFFGCVFVGLRIWGRRIKKKCVDLSDYVAIGALATVMIRFALTLQVYHWVLCSQDDNLVVAPQYAQRSAQLIFASTLVFTAALALVKIAILLGYNELFYVLIWVKRFIWSMIAVCILIFVISVVGLLSICSPIEANYDPDVKGVCRVPQSLSASLATITNIIMDAILVAIPMCVVWTLKINVAKKIAVSLMFGLGLLITIVAGLRIYAFRTEAMLNNQRMALLASLELHLGLIASCLPFIGPALGTIGRSLLGVCPREVRSRIRRHMEAGKAGSGSCPLSKV